MKRILYLLAFTLTLSLLVSACTKSKTRSIGYKCYAWKLQDNDTILVSTADFPYPLYPIQDQEDTLNTHLGGNTSYWYSCSY